MKTTITTEDTKEALRLIHSTNMACAIFNIKYNVFKKVNQMTDGEGLSSYETIEIYNQLIQDELEGIPIDALLD